MENNDTLTEEFAVIDVETANPDHSSICQIGIILCRGGEILEKEVSLIDPQTWFDPINVSIHGIDRETVKGAPTFAQWSGRLGALLSGRVVLQHSFFDRVAIGRACALHGVKEPSVSTWLDTVLVARRAWPEMARKKGGSGYSLSALCGALKYQFRHHDALEDAQAALHIFQEASRKTGLDVSGWLKRVRQPVDMEKSRERGGSRGASPARQGRESGMQRLFAYDPVHGPYLGEVLVFTGETSKRESIPLAHKVGFKVDKNVTKRTTVLVFGNQDIRQLADGDTESKKRQKVKELIAKGQSIALCSYEDFLKIAGR